MSLIVKIFLFSFLLIVCGCLETQFPDVPIYVMDVQHQVCGKYKFLDRERLTVQFVEDLPADKCESMIGFSFQNYNDAVKPWIREVIQNLKNKPPKVN